MFLGLPGREVIADANAAYVSVASIGLSYGCTRAITTGPGAAGDLGLDAKVRIERARELARDTELIGRLGARSVGPIAPRHLPQAPRAIPVSILLARPRNSS